MRSPSRTPFALAALLAALLAHDCRCGSGPLRGAPGTVTPGADCVKATTLNPSGEFANTLIRGRHPDGPHPGNTWAAVKDAAARGARYIEVDVRPTSDDVFVPTRTDSLAAFSSCKGSLAKTAVAGLSECVHSKAVDVKVRPLADGLAGGAWRGIYLDLKSTFSPPMSDPAALVRAVKTLEKSLPDPRILVAMSYTTDAARALAAAGIRTALKDYPAEGSLADLVGTAKKIGAEMLCVRSNLMTPENMSIAAKAGVWLLPWADKHDVDEALVAKIIEGHTGGLINGLPELVDGVAAKYCFH